MAMNSLILSLSMLSPWLSKLPRSARDDSVTDLLVLKCVLDLNHFVPHHRDGSTITIDDYYKKIYQEAEYGCKIRVVVCEGRCRIGLYDRNENTISFTQVSLSCQWGDLLRRGLIAISFSFVLYVSWLLFV